MPQIVTCGCGQSFRAIDELAGTQVNCPSCGQSLAIPPLESPAAPVADDPLDLGDASGFEQSAAAAPDPLADLGGESLQAAVPAYVHQQSRPESMDRSAIIAMWVGGGAVGLLLLAMALTTLLRGCGGTSGETPPTDTQSEETAPEVPAESKPAGKTAEPKTDEGADADDAEPTAATLDAGGRKQLAKRDTSL